MGIIRFPRASRPRSQKALIDPGQYRQFDWEKINLNDKGRRCGVAVRWESTRSDQIVLIVAVVMTLLAWWMPRMDQELVLVREHWLQIWLVVGASPHLRGSSLQVPVGLLPRRSPEKRVERARSSHGALRPLPHPPPPLLFHRSPPPPAQVSFSSRC